MLSNRLKTLILYCASPLVILGIVPGIWDKTRGIVVPHKHARYLLWFHTINLLVWVTFGIVQAIRFNLTQQYDLFNIAYVCASAGLLPLETFLLMTVLEDDAIGVFNSLQIFLRHMKRVYYPSLDPNKSKVSLLLDIGFIIILFSFILLTIIYWIFVITFPNSPNLFGNLLPHNAPLLIVILVGLHPCHIMLIAYMNVFVFCLTLYLYGFIVIPFVAFELRLGRKKRYYAVDQLRRPQMLIYTYRTVQLLQQRVNQILGYILIPSQTIMGKIVVFSAFTVFKNGDRMKLTSIALLGGWSVVMAFTWCTILLMGGYLHLYGERILLSWKYHEWESRREKTIISKFRKSCKPTDLRFGNTYVIRRISVLKFIRQLTRGFSRLMLMAKGNH
ncbi:unnamed protein product [Orchesella dallaii]|uniref:Odorant receptor n=1 Tax=Orchesella dallaii TaxID=48710 RepID=A0ABP1RGU4_9HEXA